MAAAQLDFGATVGADIAAAGAVRLKSETLAEVVVSKCSVATAARDIVASYAGVLGGFVRRSGLSDDSGNAMRRAVSVSAKWEKRLCIDL
jgi:hypothetical protein